MPGPHRSRRHANRHERAAAGDEESQRGELAHSAVDEKRRGRPEQRIRPIEHELTLHLTRAHELAERAKRANGAAQYEIDCARAIADELVDRVVAATRPRNE